MKLLAIDTATEACSVALLLDGAVHERYRLAPREHAALVLPMVEELLGEAGISLRQLDALAVGRGPGSFTGVRIAVSVAQGLAFAAERPLVPVSTLAALAQGAWREFGWTQVAAAIDARMEEVYWGSYRLRDGVMVADAEEGVYAPAATPLLPQAGYCGVGSGWDSYGEPLRQRHAATIERWQGERFPRAGDVAVLGAAAFAAGAALPPAQVLPVYLRDQVAHKRAG